MHQPQRTNVGEPGLQHEPVHMHTARWELDGSIRKAVSIIVQLLQHLEVCIMAAGPCDTLLSAASIVVAAYMYDHVYVHPYGPQRLHAYASLSACTSAQSWVPCWAHGGVLPNAGACWWSDQWAVSDRGGG